MGSLLSKGEAAYPYDVKLTPAEREEYATKFVAIDTDGNNEISVEELHALLLAEGVTTKGAEEAIVKTVDTGVHLPLPTRQLSFSDFMRDMARCKLERHVLRNNLVFELVVEAVALGTVGSNSPAVATKRTALKRLATSAPLDFAAALNAAPPLTAAQLAAALPTAGSTTPDATTLSDHVGTVTYGELLVAGLGRLVAAGGTLATSLLIDAQRSTALPLPPLHVHAVARILERDVTVDAVAHIGATIEAATAAAATAAAGKQAAAPAPAAAAPAAAAAAAPAGAAKSGGSSEPSFLDTLLSCGGLVRSSSTAAGSAPAAAPRPTPAVPAGGVAASAAVGATSA